MEAGEMERLKQEIYRVNSSLQQMQAIGRQPDSHISNAIASLSQSLKQSSVKLGESFVYAAIAIAFGNALLIGIVLAVIGGLK